MDLSCPLACVRVGCPEPDFLERNGTWLLTVIASVGGCFGMMLTYFLKSRCKQVNCCGVSCVRDVLDLKPEHVEITSSNGKAV